MLPLLLPLLLVVLPLTRCCPPKCNSCSSPMLCLDCEDGYLVTASGLCEQCTDFNGCKKCPTAQNNCQECKLGYGFVTGGTWGICGGCQESKCDDCRSDRNICVRCNRGYRLQSNNCQQCDPSKNCLTCTGSTNTCDSCDQRYSLVADTCQPCVHSLCRVCYAAPAMCTYCADNHGVQNDTCVPCVPGNCTLCPTDATRCINCATGLGVNLTDGYCYPCVPPCLQCPTDLNKCQACAPTYGVDGAQQCVSCDDANCLLCSLDWSNCTECRPGFGFSSIPNRTCVECTSNCSTCASSLHTQCDTCLLGFYRSAWACLPCVSSCINCTVSDCFECATGYYLSPSNNCPQCMPNCLVCDFNTSSPAGEYCTQCQPNYTLSSGIRPECIEICGDATVLTLPCDMALGVAYDGCDDNCDLEPGFTCRTQLTRSTCTYTLPLVLAITSIQPLQLANQIQVHVMYEPPLAVLDDDRLLVLFGIGNEGFRVESVRREGRNKLVLSVSYSQNLDGQPLTVTFTPDANMSASFYGSVSASVSIAAEVYYYPPEVMAIARVVLYLCYFLLVMGYLNVLVTLLSRRLAGIESMLAVQLFFISVLYKPGFLYLPFYLAYPTKYTLDYGLHLLSADPPAALTSLPREPSLGAPHLRIFGIDPGHYGNNMNVGMVLQGISFAVSVVVVLIGWVKRVQLDRIIAMDGEWELERAKKSELRKVDKVKEHALTIFMCSNMLNYAYFVLCGYLYLAGSTGIVQDAPSTVLFLVCGVFFLANLVLFGYNPDPFEFFRYSFRKACLARNHIYPYCLCIALTVLSLCFFEGLTYSSPIPLGLLMLFTLVYKPYVERRENYRAAFTLLVVVSCFSLRIYVQLAPQSQHSLPLYLFHLANVAGLSLMMVVNLVSMIYHLYFVHYIQPKVEKVCREKVMHEIEETVRENIATIKADDSVFKNIIRHDKTILDYSNQMQNKDEKESEHSETLSNRKGRLKNKEVPKQEENYLSIKKIRKEMDKEKAVKLARQYAGTLKNQEEGFTAMSPEKCPGSADKKELPVVDETNYEQYLNQHGHLVSDANYEGLRKEQIMELNLAAFAYQVVVEENHFIKIKNAEQYTVSMAKQPVEKSKSEFFDAYDLIQQPEKAD